MKDRLCYTVLLSILLTSTIVGQNLVQNGSFEDYIVCPSSTGQVFLSRFWTNLAHHSGSADYFHACATLAEVSVPKNNWGLQPAATGNAYVGLSLIFSTLPNFREYIEAELISPMPAGVSHYISFKYALADSSSWTSKNLGIYLSRTPTVGNDGSGPINVSPQIRLSDEPTRNTGWTRVEFEYISTGGEAYLVIGNFSNDGQTPVTVLGDFGFPGCYLYLDDFEILPCAYVYLGRDTSLCPGETLLLNADSPGATYLWQDNSTSNTFLVDKPGIYWVEVSNICATIRDSIVVGIPEAPVVNLGNDTIICEGKSLHLDASFENASYTWQDNSNVAQLTVNESGVYWVEVEGPCDVTSDTIEVALKDCSCHIFIPNVFTPNGDGVNDVIVPAISCPLSFYSFVVLDRWGVPVFEAESPDQEWDGSLNQRSLPAGVYLYYLTYSSADGFDGNTSGSITLLR